MDAMARIERALGAAVGRADAPGGPPRSGGGDAPRGVPRGRARPSAALSRRGRACGESDPALSDAAAAAIELLHCASLVHDDLPCFDDAPPAAGRPSVHQAFGERLALLAGDALIVLAFETLARGAASAAGPARHVDAHRGRSAGVPLGIAAGQAWECEPHVDLAAYQRAKTGALFAAATLAGAAAAGAESECWRTLGERLGEAYQVADDIRDAASSPAELGKPVGQDAALGRPECGAAIRRRRVRCGVSKGWLPKPWLRSRRVRKLPSCGA